MLNQAQGQVESEVFNAAAKNASFEPMVLRPGGVLPKDPNILVKTTGMLYGSVGVDKLAATMIDLAINGKKGELLENAEISSRGAGLLKSASQT